MKQMFSTYLNRNVIKYVFYIIFSVLVIILLLLLKKREGMPSIYMTEKVRDNYRREHLPHTRHAQQYRRQHQPRTRHAQQYRRQHPPRTRDAQQYRHIFTNYNNRLPRDIFPYRPLKTHAGAPDGLYHSQRK